MPGDIAQEIAACELAARDWRWHKVIRQWLQKDTRESTSNLPVLDLTNGAAPGQPAVRLSETSERGVYIFFHPEEWRRERREFTLDYENLEVPRAGPSTGPPLADPAATAGHDGNMAAAEPHNYPATALNLPRQSQLGAMSPAV